MRGLDPFATGSSDTNRGGGALVDNHEQDVATSFQVKPHRSFKPEAISPRSSREFVSEGEAPIPVRARPPAWASRDDLPCALSTDGWAFLDPRTREFYWDTSSEATAALLCADCPVIGECLEAAMAEERGLSHGSRYLVRGGLTPKGRWSLDGSPE